MIFWAFHILCSNIGRSPNSSQEGFESVQFSFQALIFNNIDRLKQIKKWIKALFINGLIETAFKLKDSVGLDYCCTTKSNLRLTF